MLFVVHLLNELCACAKRAKWTLITRGWLPRFGGLWTILGQVSRMVKSWLGWMRVLPDWLRVRVVHRNCICRLNDAVKMPLTPFSKSV